MESQCHVGKVSKIRDTQAGNAFSLSYHKIAYVVSILKDPSVNIPVPSIENTCVEICPARANTPAQPDTRLVLGLSIGIPLAAVIITFSIRCGCCRRRVFQEVPIPLAALGSTTSA